LASTVIGEGLATAGAPPPPPADRAGSGWRATASGPSPPHFSSSLIAERGIRERMGWGLTHYASPCPPGAVHRGLGSPMDQPGVDDRQTGSSIFGSARVDSDWVDMIVPKSAMELHSPAVGKKLWNYLRVAFFMMRKGLISKRRLIMDLNLMMKKGKLLGKSLGKNLAFHHHHPSRSAAPPRGFGLGLQEYEFSCSNSPIPVFSHIGNASKRRLNNYFPCISTGAEDEPDESSTPGPVTAATPRIEYSPQCSYLSYDLAPGEKLSPLPSPAPFSVRISNYSSEEESEEGPGSQVDDEAEEFIRRFYEQLRSQSRIGLLEYQEMLARGT
ncbi:hypothetical protein Taro_024014, partial [Colocasia esculenta]|nr:hypothetical protein [Colocasia esculenta]